MPNSTSVKFECRLFGLDALRIMQLVRNSNMNAEEFTQMALLELSNKLYAGIMEGVKNGNSSFTLEHRLEKPTSGEKKIHT